MIWGIRIILRMSESNVAAVARETMKCKKNLRPAEVLFHDL